ncbi:MAG: type II toxin-antitoxin system VapC family toxin [Treponema sp.]|nr:type II toxin-antitoxin system VapC family toxin [Treponema sp.]
MKPVYLLDTNIISEFSKPRPNLKLLKKILNHGNMCAISSTVWQESIFGYQRMPEGKRKQIVGDTMQSIKDSYEIIPYDKFASEICGELQARCEEKGKTCPRYDSQIAATAIANGMILITHNTEDFATLQEVSMLKVEDWWE